MCDRIASVSVTLFAPDALENAHDEVIDGFAFFNVVVECRTERKLLETAHKLEHTAISGVRLLQVVEYASVVQSVCERKKIATCNSKVEYN